MIETISLAAVALLLVPAVMVPIVREGVHHTRRVRWEALRAASARFAASAGLLVSSMHGLGRAVDVSHTALADYLSALHGVPTGLLRIDDTYRTAEQQAEARYAHISPPFAKFGDLVTTTIHATPTSDSGLTPCCGRVPEGLPIVDQLTIDPLLVTCGAIADPLPAPHSVQYVTAPTTRTDVLVELVTKLKANDIRWGEQNHPDLSEFSFHGGVHQVGPAAMGRPFFRVMAKKYQTYNAEMADAGTIDWTGILLEEVYEALAEYEPALIRAELLDATAVLVAWVEAIDRRAA